MARKKYTGAALALTFILGLGIGLAGGFAGGRMSVPKTPETTAQTTPAQEEQPAFAERRIALSFDDVNVYEDELSARVYMLRDHYVAEYGEEPWDTPMDDGRSLAVVAKEDLFDQLVRENLLIGHGADYGIASLSESDLEDCENRAVSYIDSLGPDLAAAFNLNTTGVMDIYVKELLSVQIYNAVLEEIQKSDEFKALSGEEAESYVMAQFMTLLETWKEECDITTHEAWEFLVFGAMG